MCTSDAVYNHEMSWLAFNWRVLAMAMDPATPLFERLRFVAIASRNLDEFFAKRVGALKRQEAAGVENLLKKRDKSIWTPGEQLRLISRAVQEMDECIAQTLLGDVLPKLREAGVFMLDYDELTELERVELREWFTEKVEPLLTPLAVDPGHPFPAIGSLTLSIAVELMDEYEESMHGGFEKHKHFAIVTVPSGLPRWKRLSARGSNAFIPVEQIIIANLDRLFGGMLVLSANMFRPTRNADVVRNEEEAEDLLEMMSDEVRERRFAPFVRLEVEASMPMELVMRVVEEMALTPQDVFTVSAGPVGLGELDSLPVQFGMDQSLLYSHWAPATHSRLMNVKKKASADGRSESIFAAIRRGDILVHHPYHSFATSTQLFVESAARDAAVVAIKATLYRTSSDSPIINALAVAAEAGKQVAVLVELKARFDEARNVGFANKLEDAGCNVAYGLVGLKTHCKATLVVRQEEDGLRTYVHLGTGNYNPRTASLYTDVGLLSCDPDLGADVSDLFKYLTGYHRQTAYRKLLVAPNAMRRQFCELIDVEIANAKEGRPATITAKMNGLDDRLLVEKLYQAAAAGVKIDLVVRGICRMRPGVPGLSENVRVVSIIGRFLEHHRIFRFENGGEPHFYIGSADWMSRNLTRRVEVCTPITNGVLKAQLQELLDACLSDGMNAWEVQPDGRYHKPCRTCATHEAVGDDRLAQRAKEVGLHSALIEVRDARGVAARGADGAWPCVRRLCVCAPAPLPSAAAQGDAARLARCRARAVQLALPRLRSLVRALASRRLRHCLRG